MENVSTVKMMAIAQFTETKSVEVMEGALAMNIQVGPVVMRCGKAKKKFQVLIANVLTEYFEVHLHVCLSLNCFLKSFKGSQLGNL